MARNGVPAAASGDSHFTPIARLALITSIIAMAGIFSIATIRTALAFVDPIAYDGTFLNRGFHADYGPDAARNISLVVATWDETGRPTTVSRTFSGVTAFSATWWSRFRAAIAPSKWRKSWLAVGGLGQCVSGTGPPGPGPPSARLGRA